MRTGLHSRLAAFAVAVIAAVVAGCGSASSPVAAPKIVVPGATGKAIMIGGFGPVSGAEGEQAVAAQAYFRFVNAHGGVYGRKIGYRYLNDQGNVRLVPSLAHQLVQQDAVFAVFSPTGTAENLQAVPYLNAARVPDVFPAASCGCLSQPAPYAFGWQPSDAAEGKVLGWYLAHGHPNERVAVVSSADPGDQAGADGLIAQVPRTRIAARIQLPGRGQGLTRQLAALRASHAPIVAVFAGPAVTARLSTVVAASGYRPQLVSAAAGAPRADGVITDSYLPALGSAPRSAAGSWVALFRRIAARYLPGALFGPDVVSGMSAAYLFTEALFRAGPNPSRASLMSALTSLPQGPAVAPLAGQQASPAVAGLYVGVFRRGALVPLTGALAASAVPSGLVRSYHGGQAAAPASGVPPH